MRLEEKKYMVQKKREILKHYGDCVYDMSKIIH